MNNLTEFLKIEAGRESFESIERVSQFVYCSFQKSEVCFLNQLVNVRKNLVSLKIT